MKSRQVRLFCASLIALLALPTAGSASSRIVYVYPPPNSIEVSTKTDIGLRAAAEYVRGSVRTIIQGSRSGVHSYTVTYTADLRMAILKVAVPFALDEDVSVLVLARLANGDSIKYPSRFRTMMRESAPEVDRELASEKSLSAAPQSEDSVPPLSIVTDRSPTQGSIVMVNFGWTPITNGCYLWVFDEHGQVRKRKSMGDSHAIDFQYQPTGFYTYFDYRLAKFYATDTDLNVIDSFICEHGYLTDGHELRFEPDGSYSLFGVVTTTQNMSTVVGGGSNNALIESDVFQHFDKDRNCIFEWRGIDHYDVFDARHEDLTAATIDMEHANSVCLDKDGNYLISNRDLDEITLISAETGEMLWRFGGVHNQFRLIGDTLGISYQHCARFLPNGHLLVFDNGCYHAQPNARAVEYELDTANRTATMVWQFHHSPEIQSIAMGYVDRLPNGNTFISWGHDSTVCSEVTPSGETVYEMRMGALNYTYRAIKYSSVPARVAPESSNDIGVTIDRSAITVDGDQAGEVSAEVHDILGRLMWSVVLASADGRASIEFPTTLHGPLIVTARTPSSSMRLKLLR
jgi:hypothetical protein